MGRGPGWSIQIAAGNRYRLGSTVKPDMNRDVYAEPFAASGHDYDYGELLEPRSRLRLTFGWDGTSWP